MITVREAAAIAGKSPETIRRWIRSGKLSAHKIGSKFVVDEMDLAEFLMDEELPVPSSWQLMTDQSVVPNVVRAVRLARHERSDH